MILLPVVSDVDNDSNDENDENDDDFCYTSYSLLAIVIVSPLMITLGLVLALVLLVSRMRGLMMS
jgi:hypothetical protein